MKQNRKATRPIGELPKRESKRVEFKQSFDPAEARDWCEVIKDLLAMVNSGGGCIYIGVKNNGELSGFDVSPILDLDTAKVTDQFAKYTGVHYDAFEIKKIQKHGNTFACIVVEGYSYPLPFTRPGTYPQPNNMQGRAFSEGTVYFRHGAKSETAKPEDFREFFEREFKKRRRELLSNIAKVTNVRTNERVEVHIQDVTESEPTYAKPIRLTNDSSAPAYRKLDYDETHPHRMKELVREVQRRIPTDVHKVTNHDIQLLRRVYYIDKDERYFHKPRFGSPQYSNELVQWIEDRFNHDASFFIKARDTFKTYGGPKPQNANLRAG